MVMDGSWVDARDNSGVRGLGPTGPAHLLSPGLTIVGGRSSAEEGAHHGAEALDVDVEPDPPAPNR